MGKGSKRRLQQIPDEQMQKNWDKIFGKEGEKKNYDRRKNQERRERERDVELVNN